jgi:hypothetical protein
MKKCAAIVFCLFVIICQTYAQEVNISQPDTISNVNEWLTWYQPNIYRQAIILNGEWEYRLKKDDPWQNVIIPSVCEYEGEYTFRKIIKIDSTYQNDRFKLVCYGVNYYCSVFVNEKFIGSHTGGHTSFIIDIPDNYFNFGKPNTLELKVNTKLDNKETIPPKKQLLGQRVGGGIIRDIFLYSLPHNYIELKELKYNLAADNSTVWLSLNAEFHRQPLETSKQPNSKLSYNVEIWDKQSPKALVQKNIPILDNLNNLVSIPIELELKNPQLWSPASPNLYQIKVQLIKDKIVTDEIIKSVGLKRLIVKDGDLSLNGERLILKGVVIYENQVGDSNYISPQIFEKQVTANLKALNANAIRIANYPPHPALVELCDRYGFLLLEELPLYFIPSAWMTPETYFNQVTSLASELMIRDQDHVSMFACGLGSPYDSLSYAISHKLYSTLKSQKLTDLLFYFNSHIISPDINVTPDIMGFDVFDTDKNEIQRSVPRWLNQFGSKVMFITSFGYSLAEGYPEAKDPIKLQEIQATQITEAWNVVAQSPRIDGYFINSLKDWQCNYPLLKLGIRPKPFSVPSGLMDNNDNKRLSYKIIESVYEEGKARLTSGTKKGVITPDVFIIVGVLSLLIFLFIYNTRRYFQESISRVFIHPHGFYVDLREFRKIPFGQTLLIAILNSIGIGLIAASFGYYFRENIFIDHLLTLITTSVQTKIFFTTLIWRPELLIFIFAFLVLLVFIAIGLIIRLFALIFRKKLRLSQALTLSYWSGANFLLYIPIGIVTYRMLIIESLFLPVVITIALILLWYLGRLIKVMRVIFFWSAFRSGLLLISVLFILIFLILYYYQGKINIVDYFQLYSHYWRSL